MIRLRNLRLPNKTQIELATLQQRINGLLYYEDRVRLAKTLFGQSNRRNNPTFSVVRNLLIKMCSGATRCCYCEDSAADEVEHIKPKDLYPQDAFVWKNYLYACGPCNGPKNNKFAVLSRGAIVDVSRKKGQPIIPPQPGTTVVINPRKEDPMILMTLDLRDTFYFLPSGPQNSIQYRRADYTIKVLRLNDRDLLPAAREEAYRSYRARLVEYIEERDSGASQKQLKGLIDALKRMGHPTVWREMKRQYPMIPELRVLFRQAPEAITW